MLLGGMSVQGKYHEENQDNFSYSVLDRGFVVALSDGLGSLRYSKEGSEALCASIVENARALGEKLSEFDPNEFIKLVHSCWLKKLSGYDISQCYATMLFFVFYAGRVFAARLGDGFIGFWLDDSLDVLFDAKENYYANETDCLTEKLDVGRVSIFEKNVMKFHGGIMCSDGIEFGEMTREELIRVTKIFVEDCREMQCGEIVNDVTDWLQEWPGTDDKTLVFFINGKEQVNEKTI